MLSILLVLVVFAFDVVVVVVVVVVVSTMTAGFFSKLQKGTVGLHVPTRNIGVLHKGDCWFIILKQALLQYKCK